MADQPLLRDVFDRKAVRRLGEQIHGVWAGFDEKRFEREVCGDLAHLSFGARMDRITDQLEAQLPASFRKAVRILLRALGPELGEPELTGFEGFIVLPQTAFVARRGLGDFETSMGAFHEMTKRFSAELHIRPFIERYPERSLALLEQWTGDRNVHVRRLVSEGTRPRLPLAGRLPAFQRDPSPVLALLERLKTDPELYVRRSVANNLNDIAKDNPDVVVATLKRWKTIDDDGTQWLIRHASRSLLKAGHRGALALAGFGARPRVRVSELSVRPRRLSWEGELTFALAVESTAKSTQRLMIDYAIDFMKANGKQAPKVFKLTEKTLRPGRTITIEKRHDFRERTTRKHHPGAHGLRVIANGHEIAKAAFSLSAPGRRRPKRRSKR